MASPITVSQLMGQTVFDTRITVTQLIGRTNVDKRITVTQIRGETVANRDNIYIQTATGIRRGHMCYFDGTVIHEAGGGQG